MQMDNGKKINSAKKNKKNDYFYKIIGVQFLAVAFMVILLIIVCRLDAVTVREKYTSLMLKDMSWHEVWASAKETAMFVFRPVDIDSVKDNATSQISEDTETAEAEEQQTNTAGSEPAEEEKTEKAQTEKEETTERKTAEVMSLFSSDSQITLPLHGRISSRFGSRIDPISGEGAVHKAVDIAVNEGTRVGAAWDGIVTEAGNAPKKGNYIWMVHKNGCETLYCHLSELLVKKGDVIRAGEAIALSGNTGYSTGPHLHFGIRKNGEMVDPLNYITETNGYI